MKKLNSVMILCLSQLMFAHSEELPKGKATQCDLYHLQPPKLKSFITPPPPILEDSTDVYQLESLPGASGVIYLNTTGRDFSGDSYWAVKNQPFSLPGIGLGESAIYATWLTLKEDFAPFDLNITTDSTVFQSYPIDNRLEVVVSASSARYSNRTGFAALGVSYGTDNQAFCFSDAFANDTDGYRFSEVCSHEAGHTFGLKHDGGREGSYYFGHGESDDYWKYWSTIMGSGTAAEVSHWSQGEYVGANNTEDDIGIISSFHFGFRPDDHGDNIESATQLEILENKYNQVDLGVIEHRTDKDYFEFSTPGGVAFIEVNPAVYKPNLKVELTLWNEQGEVIQSHSHIDNSLDASVAAQLDAGKYFVSIEGVGLDVPSGGFSDYGSLGYYSMNLNLEADESVLSNMHSNLTSSTLNSSIILSQGMDFVLEEENIHSVQVFSVNGEEQSVPYKLSDSLLKVHFHSMKPGVWLTRVAVGDQMKLYQITIVQ